MMALASTNGRSADARTDFDNGRRRLISIRR
jgi:hypothetical protein